MLRGNEGAEDPRDVALDRQQALRMQLAVGVDVTAEDVGVLDVWVRVVFVPERHGDERPGMRVSALLRIVRRHEGRQAELMNQ